MSSLYNELRHGDLTRVSEILSGEVCSADELQATILNMCEKLDRQIKLTDKKEHKSG